MGCEGRGTAGFSGGGAGFSGVGAGFSGGTVEMFGEEKLVEEIGFK